MSPLPRAESGSILPYTGDVSPQEAWEALNLDKTAQLVDVRTPEEWREGVPCLAKASKSVHKIALKLNPDYQDNPAYMGDFLAQLPNKDAALYFLCRGGGRSAMAAAMASQLGYKACYNIAGGFEGKPGVVGWKAANLPVERE